MSHINAIIESARLIPVGDKYFGFFVKSSMESLEPLVRLGYLDLKDLMVLVDYFVQRFQEEPIPREWDGIFRLAIKSNFDVWKRWLTEFHAAYGEGKITQAWFNENKHLYVENTPFWDVRGL